MTTLFRVGGANFHQGIKPSDYVHFSARLNGLLRNWTCVREVQHGLKPGVERGAFAARVNSCPYYKTHFAGFFSEL
jgi:hypothetical protein